MLTKRPFYKWDDLQNETWSLLYSRAYPRVLERACERYWRGHHKMGLTESQVPNFEKLAPLYQEWVGWDLVSTNVQYSDGQSWFEHLKAKKFLVTEYIRERDSLDYTPLPDIFHDAFGHLPFMTEPDYTDLVWHYAKLMLLADGERRRALGSIWWYTIEFGLIEEAGQTKAFGAGLMSSYEEIEVAFSDRVKRSPFNPEEMGKVAPSPHAIHQQLWVLESFEQLNEFVHTELERYL